MDEDSQDQTQVIPCGNIIFIFTTNAATDVIEDFAVGNRMVYTAQDPKETEEKHRELEALLRYKLQGAYPFTDAFIARVDKIVPFLPMARGVDSSDDHPLMHEAMTVSKMLIEEEQEKLQVDQEMLVKQYVNARNKHAMAKLVVMESIEEAGVRSLQKNVARFKLSQRFFARVRLRSNIIFSACWLYPRICPMTDILLCILLDNISFKF